MKKKILLLIVAITLIGNTVFSKSAKAQTTSNHFVTYSINSDLSTEVNHKIVLSHSDKYTGINKLVFEEPISNLLNLIKTDKDTEYTLSNLDNKVEVLFKNTLLGPIEKTIEYKYKSDQIIKKVGTTYLLEVPKINGNLIDTYDLKIYVPKNINVQNYQSKIGSDIKGNYIYFTKQDLSNYGKYINFGDFVFYEVAVKHLISNEKNYIVIPPTIPNRQTVFIKSISKNPNKIYKDFDNNTIFEYQSPKSIEGINAVYLIKIYGNASKQTISNFDDYTKPLKNWDYRSNFVKKLVNTVKTDSNITQNAFYTTITNLEYNQSSLNYNYLQRIGAENLNEKNSKKAVCLEYSDLLIAILRGLEIPAREINGFTYKNLIDNYENPNLHSWVDYYSNGYWLQADPTYSDTSDEDYFLGFDLFHIAFLIKSQNSEYPILTGSYSKNGINEQIKISAVNIPNKKDVTLKVVDLFVGKYLINDSFEYLQNIHPKSALFISNKNFEEVKKLNSDFYVIKTIPANYKDFFAINLYGILALIIVLIGSVTVFWFLHKKLKKSAPKAKHKVSQIV